tara:strand:- start:260 stop:496 length:237 start_codon:yes stop_codon:yes gene_type:complete
MNNRKKQTEKFALQAMAIVMLWFIFLWVLMSLIACNNSQCHKDIYIPQDNVMDSVDMDCGGEYHGKEGKSEYGEYNGN